jgi:hypothetical protein
MQAECPVCRAVLEVSSHEWRCSHCECSGYVELKLRAYHDVLEARFGPEETWTDRHDV